MYVLADNIYNHNEPPDLLNTVAMIRTKLLQNMYSRCLETEKFPVWEEKYFFLDLGHIRYQNIKLFKIL
jgi:hypothetical protein